jgi:ABC-2 type transport system permease protein
MFETARYEGRRRIRGTIVLTAAVSLYTAFIVWYFSALEGVDYDEVFEQVPPAIRDAFGIEALSTIEGFLSAQVFNFVWLLGLGLYFAYTAGSLVAGDVEDDRLDLLLSFPVSRTRLLAEKFGALLLPLVTVNVVGGGVIYALVAAAGETIDPTHLALVHLFSVPYLLVCAGVGLVFSVLVDRAAIAERGAVGVVFALYLIESVVGSSTEFSWLEYASPTNYYDPTAILVRESANPLDAAVLLAAFVVLFLVSGWLFRRRDI